MIRILIFILWVAFFAGVLTLLSAVRGEISAEAFGWRFDLPVGAAIAALFLFGAFVAGATSLLKDAFAAPRTIHARKEISRREKGVMALSRGLDALAAGDGAGAKKEADVAMKTLGAAPVARLLAAQALQLKGDDSAAAGALSGMLSTPETEFLALRGLYAKAVRDNDRDAARAHAERAFSLHPGARWAFSAALDEALIRDDYAAARAVIERALKAGTLDVGTAARGAAACLAASAFAANAAGEAAAALTEAEAALKRQPGFPPAAALAARLHAERGETRKSEKLLLDAFAAVPARATAEALDHLYKDHEAAARSERIDKLAARNPASIEASLQRAKARLLGGDAAGAARLLEDALKISATARPLSMMAAAQRALGGEEAARVWLERASEAPRDDEPSAGRFFDMSPDSWRRLIRLYIDEGRLAPAPIEGAAPGLPDEAFWIRPAATPVAIADAQAETAPVAAPEETSDETLYRDVAAARIVS